jgi:hypothetical protein
MPLLKFGMIALVLLVIAFGFISYMLFWLPTNETKNFKVINEASYIQNISSSFASYDSYPEGMLFYDTIRFPDKQISYSINSDCSENMADDAIKAFEILQSQTILKFNKIKSSGEIEVLCSQDVKFINKNNFIAGEGGPSVIINTTRYHVILNGTILLYKTNDCSQPVVAIHEILHALGFKHSNNPISILYNTSDCDNQITPEIPMKIQELYKDESLPDLSFEYISANKSGRYLNFKIDIINAGLKESPDVNLSVYADNRKVAEYNLGNFDIGLGRSINVENVKIPFSASNLTFSIDDLGRIVEIDKVNNIRRLTLE